MRLAGWIALAVVALASGAGAEGSALVAGRQMQVTDDGMGGATLVVDGAVLHEDGVIYLDPGFATIPGATIVTGAAGAGGNGCNAAPFVLVLPDTGAPEFWGPVDSCAYFTATAQGDGVRFSSDAVPGSPGETWVWSRAGGFVPGPAVGFVATQGWEALDSLAGAHPVDAMALAPVLQALQTGLGSDYPAFAERISELGSGDLTATGYLGEACLKFTCEADWALLYLHRETQQVFAIWHVYGEIENRVYPQDTTQWPPEAMALLRERAGP